MRAQLSNHDYEQLSAYMDGQLAPAEKRKLEERLRAHADLQAAFDELSRTRALLRNAPRRRAPRNFTLTPAMVEEKTTRRWGNWFNLFPVLSFTSALATLALVASIVFQLLPGQAPATMSAAPAQSQSDRVANIVQETMTAMQITPPADRNLEAPQAQKAAPESGRSAQPAQSPAQPLAAAGAAPTATLELPSAADSSQNGNTPPIITWNGTSPGGGGYGGGGGQGPSMGPLLGPPSAAAPDTAAPNMALGKGGGGGDITSGTSGSIVIPSEGTTAEASASAAASAEATAAEPAAAAAQAQSAAQPTAEAQATPAPAGAAPLAAPTEISPAPVNPEINGPGPILGVPSSTEGGQIVEKKAILGQAGTAQEVSGQPAQPQPGAQQPVNQPRPGGPALLIGQVLLIVIAIATGVAAFLVRRQSKAK